jgi:hypothetical protein
LIRRTRASRRFVIERREARVGLESHAIGHEHSETPSETKPVLHLPRTIGARELPKTSELDISGALPNDWRSSGERHESGDQQTLSTHRISGLG